MVPDNRAGSCSAKRCLLDIGAVNVRQHKKGQGYGTLDFIDTHAHLDIAPLCDDPGGALARARAVGVSQVLTIGIDAESSRAAVELATSFPQVFAAVGIHPHDAKDATKAAYERIQELAVHPKVVAWGEIGLDFVKEYSPRAAQEAALRRQLGLARDAGLPVIIHDREAHAALLSVLRDEAGKDLRGVVHCFSGDVDVARRVLNLGLFISVTGVLTFPKAQILREVVRFVPLECLLIETDAPFLAPVPNRGRPNEPSNVVHIAQKVAEIKQIPLEDVAQCTSTNARDLFGLPTP